MSDQNDHADPSGTGYGALAPSDMSAEQRDAARLTVALAWIGARSAAVRALDADIVLGPGWDILLDLFVNTRQGRRVSVSSLCLAPAAPASTALRWIDVLEARGLLRREPDPTDKRRIFVTLTELGLSQVGQALDNSAQSDRKLGIGRMRFTEGD